MGLVCGCGVNQSGQCKFIQVVLTGGVRRATLGADTGFGRLRHPDLQAGRTRPVLCRSRCPCPVLLIQVHPPSTDNPSNQLLPVEPRSHGGCLDPCESLWRSRPTLSPCSGPATKI